MEKAEQRRRSWTLEEVWGLGVERTGRTDKTLSRWTLRTQNAIGCKVLGNVVSCKGVKADLRLPRCQVRF